MIHILITAYGFMIRQSFVPTQTTYSTVKMNSCAKYYEGPGGGNIRTCTCQSKKNRRLNVGLYTSNDSPIDADIELWEDPNDTPCKLRIYSEDGYPISTTLFTAQMNSTVVIRNIAKTDMPLFARVFVEKDYNSTNDNITHNTSPVDTVPVTAIKKDQTNIEHSTHGMIVPTKKPTPITKGVVVPTKDLKGRSLQTYMFDESIESVGIAMHTDGRPLNGRIEMFQDSNCRKQVIEMYTIDGIQRPFVCRMPTPGDGNTLRVVNTAAPDSTQLSVIIKTNINHKYKLKDSDDTSVVKK